MGALALLGTYRTVEQRHKSYDAQARILQPHDRAVPLYTALITSTLLSLLPPNRMLNRTVVTVEVDKRRTRRVGRPHDPETVGPDRRSGHQVGSKCFVGFDKPAIERELVRES